MSILNGIRLVDESTDDDAPFLVLYDSKGSKVETFTNTLFATIAYARLRQQTLNEYNAMITRHELMSTPVDKEVAVAIATKDVRQWLISEKDNPLYR